MAPGAGDDEDFVGSGSGAGPTATDGSGDRSGDRGVFATATTQLFTGNTRTVQAPDITTPVTVGTSGDEGVPQDDHGSHGEGMHLWMIVGVAATLTLFLLAALAFCLVRRKRKAAMAQRSARWDRASGANVAAAQNAGGRANPSTKPTSLKGYYLGAPTGPPPSTAPPPPPDEGVGGPGCSPPPYLDPRSPTQLLQYDSLNQDGCYDNPVTGYQEPPGENTYEQI